MRKPAVWMLLLAVLSAVVVVPGAVARAAVPEPGGDAIVARVGAATLTVRELERRLAKVPRFQLATYGRTSAEIRRGFLDKVIVPELLLSQGAAARGLGGKMEVRTRERDVLKSATLRQLRDETERAAAPTDADVRAYYEANRARFDSPARFSIWRILVAGRDEAARILAETKKDPTPKTWNELARTRSLDKATHLRGGNLGFVAETGESSDEKIRVDRALIEAVKGVKDGEMVGQPVPEGSGFAVVWRRGSTPPVHRSLEDEQTSIKRQLARDRAREAQDKLIAALRTKHLKASAPSLLDLIEVNSSGEITAKAKPGRIERRPGALAPEPTPRGLR
jgi:peptidyl-prolyl cis-trans isomerase C